MLCYLLAGVEEGVRSVDREDDEEDVGAWIGQLPQGAVLLLTCCVPESQVDQLSVYAQRGRQVIEDCRLVFLGKLVLRETV